MMASFQQCVKHRPQIPMIKIAYLRFSMKETDEKSNWCENMSPKLCLLRQNALWNVRSQLLLDTSSFFSFSTAEVNHLVRVQQANWISKAVRVKEDLKKASIHHEGKH